MSVYCNLQRNKIPEPERNMPFGLDKDTLLITALLFLLIKDGGDMKLILALGYILL
ncbi:MAG: hypothetical protein NC340_08575 [Ruminococcus flavefaciens]|nr:hypothetical protein [Ruminococcus flavefaciens]MCM1230334.1 hypothetical protein [Ruminococcus flavefaciens]